MGSATITTSSMELFWRYYWTMLHLITYMYPIRAEKSHRIEITSLFHKLATDMPYRCKKCSTDYLEYLSKNPLHRHCSGRRGLTRWLIDLHNIMNTKKGKQQFGYHEINQRYRDTEKVNRELMLDLGIDIKNYLLEQDSDWGALVVIGRDTIREFLNKSRLSDDS